MVPFPKFNKTMLAHKIVGYDAKKEGL